MVTFVLVGCASNCNSCRLNKAGFCDAGQCHLGYRLSAAKTCDGTTESYTFQPSRFLD